MGYRSDVDVVFYTLNKEKLPYAVIKLWFDENYPDPDAEEITHGEDYIRISYRQWKWYDGYDEVRAVEQAIANFRDAFQTDDPDTDAAYEMVELGEDVGDITMRGSAYCTYRLHVHREIMFD
jgi:hypothetical protein